MRKLIENFLRDIGVDTDVNRDNYRGTMKELLISDTEDYQKDVAFVVGLIHQNSDGKFLSNFDVYYDIALKFVDKYPPDIDWEGEDIEETVVEFINDYNNE